MANTQLTDKIAVVLDLGTSKIRAMAVVLDNDKVSHIIATEKADSKGVKHGKVDNHIELAGVVKPMLTNLQNRIYNKIKESVGEAIVGNEVVIKSVYIALGGTGIFGKKESEIYRLNNEYVGVPVVTSIKEKIRDRVQNDKDEILEFINQGYNIDDEIRMEPVGCRATNIEGRYCMVMANKDVKQDVINMLSLCQCTLAGYVLTPFALANVMLSDADKEVGAVLVDLGASSTSIAIYKDNVRRHVMVLPVGGKIITKDIKKVCGLTSEQAEKIKKKLGYAYPGGVEENILCSMAGTNVKVESLELSKIIEARLDQLMSYLLGEMCKVNAISECKKIILTGRASRLNKISEKFTNEFGVDTEIGTIVDKCYEKYASYFMEKSELEKAIKDMNEFAACLGVLESTSLESCTFIGKKQQLAQPKPKEKKGGFLSTLFNDFRIRTEGLIEGQVEKTELK